MCRDASFAAIGLENMLNAGGAVRSLKLRGADKSHTGAQPDPLRTLAHAPLMSSSVPIQLA